MLRTEGLSFSYKTSRGKQRVFKNLNLNFPPGFNIILGPNGAGKTTLLRSIFGLLKYNGHIWHGEDNITYMGVEEKTKIMSYLPQTDTNTSRLSVFEMVLLGLLPDLGRKVKDQDINRVEEILEGLNISQLGHRNFSELSGGQKQMVYIAQTLVRNPKVILLDEPVNSLDLQKQFELCCFLENIIKTKSINVIVVVHDINLASRFADNMIILDSEGDLYSRGSPQEVINEKMLREVYGVIGRIHYDEESIPTVSIRKSVNDR